MGPRTLRILGLLAAAAAASGPGAAQEGPPTGRLFGEVHGPEDRAAGAEVVLTRVLHPDLLRSLPDLPLEKEVRQATADSRGRFAFQVPAGLPHAVQARLGGLVSPPHRGLMAGDPALVQLVPAASLEVSIPGGGPAQAWLLRHDPELDRWERAAAADGEGVLRMEDLAPGPYRLAVAAGCGAVVEAKVGLAPGRRQHVGAEAFHLGAVLQGRVVGPGGAPLRGARLQVGDRPGAAVSTDAKGRFTLGGIPAEGTLWAVHVSAAGHRQQVRWLRSTSPGEAMEGVFEMEEGRALHVRCMAGGPTSAPLSGAHVLAFRPGLDDILEARAVAAARTRADGVAVLEGLPAGPLVLLVLGGDGWVGRRRVPPAAEEGAEVLVDRPLARGDVDVLLRDTDGAPLAGARVRLVPEGLPLVRRPLTRELFTDRRGRVAFREVPAGDHRLVAESPPLAPWSAVVAVPEGERVRLERRLEPGLKVEGTVVDAIGRPAPGVALLLRQQVEDMGLGERTAVADARGRFVFTGLPPGVFVLFASRQGEGVTESGLLRGVLSGGEPVRLRIRSEDPEAGR